MPPPHPPTYSQSRNPLAAARPLREIFDPWNSSSTGHQHAENRLSGSTAWRDSRTTKLHEQYGSGHTGGRRMADSVGAGSEGWEKWMGNKNLSRDKRQLDLSECFQVTKAASSLSKGDASQKDMADVAKPLTRERPGRSGTEQAKRIFSGLNIYINGSTYPFISDHRLRRLLVSHGAHMSIALGRRTVTHVIIGRPGADQGSGGGLSASKIEKEIAKVRGKSIRFVTAEWAVESIKAGTRLPESRFVPLKLAKAGQGSVMDTFSKINQNIDQS